MGLGAALLCSAARRVAACWWQGRAGQDGRTGMTDLVQLKAEARAAAFAARKAAFGRGQGQAAEILADVLAAHRGKVLAGYMPMRTEIDPLAAMAAHQGPVGVPVILGPGQALKFREWSPGCDIEEGAFKAYIPVEGAWVEPEVVIVPLVAFDARGFRLGYGGGFYDRTLEGLRAKRPTIAVGFAFDAQEMPEVPIEDTDQKLDFIVTESGVRAF
jgi:5-formyltetrahydrofolate cyclo-ligase